MLAVSKNILRFLLTKVYNSVLYRCRDNNTIMSKHINVDPTQTLVVRMTASGIGSRLHSPRAINQSLILGFMAYQENLTAETIGPDIFTSTAQIVQYMHQSPGNVLRLLHGLEMDGKIISAVARHGKYWWQLSRRR